MKEFFVFKTDLFTKEVISFHFSSFDAVKAFLEARKELIRLYGCFYSYKVLMLR